MLGLGFIAGGIKYSEQTYNLTVAKEIGGLNILAILSMVIPTASRLLSGSPLSGIVHQSRGTAFTLIFTYACLLYFQFRSHKYIFMDVSEQPVLPEVEARCQTPSQAPGEAEQEETQYAKPPHYATALISLVTATALVGFHTSFATDNLSTLMSEAHLSRSFVGVVILPLLSNDLGPIKAAWRGQMDECITSTIGKCVQTSLVIVPSIIFIAWGMGIDDMTLNFGGFEVATLFASSLYVNFLINDGKSNYFEGVALIALFIIISIAAYYVP
ncbi:hypothetical protein BDW75DRAFT_235565 [Aspergillus navahoensis]